MRPITVIRAVQWAAVAVTGWSLSLPWGTDLAVGKGPPAQWERHIVGASLLLMIAALASSLTARKNGKPGAQALIVSAAMSLGALALAMSIRSTSMENGQAHVLAGGGWMWMVSGCIMSVGAVASAITLRVLPAKNAVLAGGEEAPSSVKRGATKPKSAGKKRRKNKKKR